MTCPKCGMTVFWDCECDTEYNKLVRETLARQAAEDSQQSVADRMEPADWQAFKRGSDAVNP